MSSPTEPLAPQPRGFVIGRWHVWVTAGIIRPEAPYGISNKVEGARFRGRLFRVAGTPPTPVRRQIFSAADTSRKAPTWLSEVGEGTAMGIVQLPGVRGRGDMERAALRRGLATGAPMPLV
jgi:hypothetical protein